MNIKNKINIQIQNSENEFQHKNNALSAVQDDEDVANSLVTEIPEQRDDFLSSFNNYLVYILHLYIFVYIIKQ